MDRGITNLHSKIPDKSLLPIHYHRHHHSFIHSFIHTFQGSNITVFDLGLIIERSAHIYPSGYQELVRR